VIERPYKGHFLTNVRLAQNSFKILVSRLKIYNGEIAASSTKTAGKTG
jgi:hypothetical protein